MGKPINTDDEDCPLWQKPVKKVCHKCPLYMHVRGLNPQTGEEMDHWGCSLAFMPVLMIDNTQQQRQTGAAVESFRNEMMKSQAVMGSLMLQRRRDDDDPKLIEG